MRISTAVAPLATDVGEPPQFLILSSLDKTRQDEARQVRCLRGPLQRWHIFYPTNAKSRFLMKCANETVTIELKNGKIV